MEWCGIKRWFLWDPVPLEKFSPSVGSSAISYNDDEEDDNSTHWHVWKANCMSGTNVNALYLSHRIIHVKYNVLSSVIVPIW